MWSRGTVLSKVSRRVHGINATRRKTTESQVVIWLKIKFVDCVHQKRSYDPNEREQFMKVEGWVMSINLF